MQKSSNVSKTHAGSTHHSPMESTAPTVVSVYSLNDGATTCSEKQWPTYLNEPLLIMPKPLALELNKNSVKLKLFLRHMMLYFSQFDKSI